MGRFAAPGDIARAIAFLADTEQSGFVNGHTLVVDGGWTADGSWQSLRSQVLERLRAAASSRTARRHRRSAENLSVGATLEPAPGLRLTVLATGSPTGGEDLSTCAPLRASPSSWA